ncbi:MAG TPA: bifunctional glutamate N-acetyltransferase/amino-acid acetyltransferase ArgJ [Candidatus Methylomirabilis sp.]|jgi:glutamate N-acetyltransferase/amino-acid N-acetyltransferase|nr:bifunctional glutamate N-acetyltransferase/amino-acid acetyltransferase ArgJ [Candidatus Methylomirabilis sp.]
MSERAITPVAGGITVARGVRAGGVHCGIKRQALDLALVASERPASVAATCTTNLVAAAPILLCRRRLAAGRFAALVANSGNANACTGAAGLADAERMGEITAAALGVPVEEVYVASTGVIGARLPMGNVEAGIRDAAARLRPEGGPEAAEAILTTDTRVKEAAREVRLPEGSFRVGGMAKGSGMIAPDMATMLAFLATDLSVPPPVLRAVLQEAVAGSFNCITVDGETSTNDMVLAFANGRADAPAAGPGTASLAALGRALTEVCGELARMIVADGEGATKVVEILVRGARNPAEARRIGLRVANSPLVKTAFHGQDSNWGRIMAALGSAGVAVDPTRVAITVGDVPIVRGGVGLGAEAERTASARMREQVFTVTVDLGLGSAEGRVWTTDLSEAYVRINAAYRS